MFNKKNDTHQIDSAIATLFSEMENFEGHTREYAELANQIEKLYKIKDNMSGDHVSADVKATILGNLLGIVLIVGHERAHVVTSKALMFVGKLK